ncbi:MAG TPA: Gfo/Idh/MocA family oxidoreductase, partial [Candidatus Hydrogenedentes bacterium]|nr:Gfo/Idh/MocA family oxidoreductase [Candidatus Hydrogenedentota bacterium]
MENLRLGFIGAGFIARFQAEALRNVRGAQLAGVHAIKGAEELSALAKRTGIGECKVYPSVAELCKNVDAVALFAPNYVRVELMEQVAEAVKAGAQLKGIICEKPLGRTVSEAKRLVDLVRETGLPNAYFENQLHMKCIQKA